MKYNKEEYKKMILELNFNKNKKLMWIVALITFFVVACVMFIINREFITSFIIGLFGGIAGFYAMKQMICESAKKANFIMNIISVEQNIDEEKLEEKVTNSDGSVSEGVYYYKDIMIAKEDKKNFYLYINKYAGVIVEKKKLNNVDEFRNCLSKNNLIK